jgi:ribosomal protein S20
MEPSMANKHWISEIKTKVLRVAYEVEEDEYSKEKIINALDEIANELDNLYPR